MDRGVSNNAIVIDVSYRPGAARKQDVFTRELDEPFLESTAHPLEAYLCYLVQTRPLVDHLTISRPATGASVTLGREVMREACASSDYTALTAHLQALKDAGAVARAPLKPEDLEVEEQELGQPGEDEPIEDEAEKEPVNPEFEDDGWYYADED